MRALVLQNLLKDAGVQGLVELHLHDDGVSSDEACVCVWQGASEARVQAICMSSGDGKSPLAIAWVSGDMAIYVPLDKRHPMCLREVVCQHPVPQYRRVFTSLGILDNGMMVVGDVVGGMATFDCGSDCGQFATLRSFTTAHRGGKPLQVLRRVQSGLFVTGGSDGQVKVWSTLSAQYEPNLMSLFDVWDTKGLGFRMTTVRGLCVVHKIHEQEKLDIVVGTMSADLVRLSFEIGGKSAPELQSDENAAVEDPEEGEPGEKEGEGGDQDQEVVSVQPNSELSTAWTASVIATSHHGGATKCLSLRPTLARPPEVACGGDDMWLRVWDLNSNQQIRSRHFDEPINAIAYSEAGDLLVCALGGRLVLGQKPLISQLLRLNKDGSYSCVFAMSLDYYCWREKSSSI